MFRIVWIKHCFQVVAVTPNSSRIFWWAAPFAGEATRIRHGWFGHKGCFQQQFMLPIVAVVVHICEGGTYARHHRGKAYPLCVDQSQLVKTVGIGAVRTSYCQFETCRDGSSPSP